jgi:ribosomal protein S18 acetylase RimI-like enzyme
VLSICAVAELTLRPARVTDSKLAAPLLYESAAGMYDRFAGNRERALRLLERSVDEPGNSSSSEVVTVAELDERVVGALAAFPVGEAASRSRAFLRLSLRSTPPWRWLGVVWLFWAGAHATPSPPEETLYVDALAVDAGARRRGAARALLAEAERQARERGLPAVSLDTALNNKAARSLYLSAGFDEVAYRPPGRGLPGFVALVKRVGPAPLS